MKPAPLTTPDALAIAELQAEMVRAGADVVAPSQKLLADGFPYGRVAGHVQRLRRRFAE